MFFQPDTYLPMMYMPDAIRATIELMEAPADRISVPLPQPLRNEFFREIANEIKRHRPEFAIHYQPDYRQAIADSWPQSIDDSVSPPRLGLERRRIQHEAMTRDMLVNLQAENRRAIRQLAEDPKNPKLF